MAERNTVSLGWTVFILGGFSTGDRFAFGSVDQHVRNLGMNDYLDMGFVKGH